MKPSIQRRHLLLLAGGSLLAAGTGLAQSGDEVVVLVNGRNPTQSLNKTELAKLFLGQTAFWHGVVPVKLFIRPDSSKSAQAFYSPVLGMTPQAFCKHWDEIQLAGKGVAPKSCDGVDELVQNISKAPGGVGFALTSEMWQVNGVKVITLK